MRKPNLVLIGMLATSLFQPLPAISAESNGGRGGGDSLSARIRDLEAFMGTDGAQLRSRVLHVLTNLSKLETDGPIKNQIAQFVKRGLKEDVRSADYQLAVKCTDASGEERSASTMTTNVDQHPGEPRPSICINIRKLAEENAKPWEILGLLFHEHSRHFGVEDTDPLDIHPIAEFISDHYAALDPYDLKDPDPDFLYQYRNHLTRAVPVLKDGAVDTYNGVTVFTASHAETTELVIQSLQGKCPRGTVRLVDEKYHSETIGQITPGARFRIPPAPSHLQLDFHNFFGPSGGAQCHVTLALANEHGTRTIPASLDFSWAINVSMDKVDLSENAAR